MSTDSGMRWAHIAALMALGCGGATSSEEELVMSEPGPGCLLLTTEDPSTHFRVLDGEWVQCLKVRAGVAVAITSQGGAESWVETRGNCSELPECVP
jgi:hypothetical protein